MGIGNKFCLIVALLVASLPQALAHTSDAKLVNATVTGLGGLGRDFEFLDDYGKLRRLSDLNGQVVSVFFGFTNCPDVCPGFLAKASVISEQLGAAHDKYTVVFVTVDPARDTREVLSNYLRLFGDFIIGARIPSNGITQLAADFGISNQIVADSAGNITINHTVGSFLFDTQGVAREYMSASKDAHEYFTQVQKLLAES